MREPKVTHSELQAAIEEAHRMADGDVLQEKPEGYFTAAEYADSRGLPRRTACDQLARLVKEGGLVKVRCRYHGPLGFVVGVAYGLAAGKRKRR